MAKKDFPQGFDTMYKASPNSIDRNKIKQCFDQGMTVEETAATVRVQCKSVERYQPDAKAKAK